MLARCKSASSCNMEVLDIFCEFLYVRYDAIIVLSGIPHTVHFRYILLWFIYSPLVLYSNCCLLFSLEKLCILLWRMKYYTTPLPQTWFITFQSRDTALFKKSMFYLPERNKICIVVEMDRVLDVLPVFGVLRIGISVVTHLGTRACAQSRRLTTTKSFS